MVSKSTRNSDREAIKRLTGLLESAEKNTGPIILDKQDYDLSKVEEIQVVTPKYTYQKSSGKRIPNGHQGVSGEELIAYLITVGFEIVIVAIIPTIIPKNTTTYELQITLVRYKGVSLTKFGLSVRAQGILLDIGVTTIEQLSKKTRSELLGARFQTKAFIKEVDQALARYGQ